MISTSNKFCKILKILLFTSLLVKQDRLNNIEMQNYWYFVHLSDLGTNNYIQSRFSRLF